jgi:hypothetical protein
MTNEPFSRGAAGRLGMTESVLTALLDAHLLDELDGGLLTIHDIEENRPHRKPSDSPEATRQRQATHRHAPVTPLSRPVTPLPRDLGSGDGDGSVSSSLSEREPISLSEGESEGEQKQPVVTDLHPITRQTRKRKPTVAEPAPEPTPSPITGDPFDLVYGRFPKSTTREWHDRLVTLYPGKVDDAMRQAIKTDPDPATLLSRTEAILKDGTRAAIEATTSAEIDAEVAHRAATRAAWEAESAGKPAFAPKPWHEVIAAKQQVDPPDHSAELKAKQKVQRAADRKTRLEHPENRLPPSPVASLLGIARMATL